MDSTISKIVWKVSCITYISIYCFGKALSFALFLSRVSGSTAQCLLVCRSSRRWEPTPSTWYFKCMSTLPAASDNINISEHNHRRKYFAWQPDQFSILKHMLWFHSKFVWKRIHLAVQCRSHACNITLSSVIICFGGGIDEGAPKSFLLKINQSNNLAIMLWSILVFKTLRPRQNDRHYSSSVISKQNKIHFKIGVILTRISMQYICEFITRWSHPWQTQISMCFVGGYQRNWELIGLATHSADGIFKCIFLNENVWISIKISLNVVPRGPINNVLALVQIMAWCLVGVKPLCEPMLVNLLTHISHSVSIDNAVNAIVHRYNCYCYIWNEY